MKEGERGERRVRERCEGRQESTRGSGGVNNGADRKKSKREEFRTSERRKRER